MKSVEVVAQSELDCVGVLLFSLQQITVTPSRSKYPDVLQRLPSLLKDSVWSCVLDCEAVAYDTSTKQILPFQVKGDTFHIIYCIAHHCPSSNH